MTRGRVVTALGLAAVLAGACTAPDRGTIRPAPTHLDEVRIPADGTEQPPEGAEEPQESEGTGG